ncbi:MAG TPA: methyltransferase domain-containing protein [Streptosporangiaceae bacterium]|nr:methyltransferase domain-containing protein [Streptosporangiaceae bacterium]
MGTVSVNADRYASLEYQGIYLRNEWGDVLFPDLRTDGAQGSAEMEPLKSDELIGDGRPGRFYQRAAAITATWAAGLGITARRVCDVGGSTGRLLHELAGRVPDADELVLAEPSAAFCTWARRLLLGEDFDRWVPMPGPYLRADHRLVEPASLPKPIPKALIYGVTASDIPRPEGYFDVVTCMNVLDRVDDPAAFAGELLRLVRPGGLLVISSPMHFDEHYTSRDRWIGDVHEVLDPVYWRVDDREVDVRYEVWQARRRIISYLSQVVGAVRLCRPAGTTP